MAVPVGTTAMWVRAIGEPWHKVGLRPARYNWDPKEGLLRSEAQKHRGLQRRQVALGTWKALEASCLQVSCSQGPRRSL